MTTVDGIKQAASLKPAQVDSKDTADASESIQRQTDSPGGKQSPVKEAGTQRIAVIEAAGAIASFVQNLSRELRFEMDEQSGRTVITVMDSNTNQVIRQIPDEEILALARLLEESTQNDPRGVLIRNEA